MKQPNFDEFKHKTIVITGGSGVLCSAMAEALAAQGAQIGVLNRNVENAQAVADRIIASGGHAIAIATDVLDKESLKNAHQIINDQLGPCDILINGAGGNHPGGTTKKSQMSLQDLKSDEELLSFFDLDPQGISYVFDLNFMGTLLPTQVFAKDMVGRSGCSVLNISSMSAYSPLTKIPAYSGAKAAVNNFTQWLAVHFSKVDIRVNAIAPGFFLTEQNRRLLTDEKGDYTERAKTILAHTPMSRFGTPEDLLGAVLWLCSSGASFVTGTVIPVDGGFNAYSGV